MGVDLIALIESNARVYTCAHIRSLINQKRMCTHPRTTPFACKGFSGRLEGKSKPRSFQERAFRPTEDRRRGAHWRTVSVGVESNNDGLGSSVANRELKAYVEGVLAALFILAGGLMLIGTYTKAQIRRTF